MNPQNFDHPDLTAFALGELASADAARVRQLLAQSPEVRAEFERIQDTIGMLRDAPALPKRTLHPRQRETVLSMGQTPAPQPKNVVPFHGFRLPAGGGHAARTASGVAWGVTKFAVAACLVVGAFMLGQRTANRTAPAVADQAAPKSEAPKAAVEKPEVSVVPAPTKTAVTVAVKTTKAPEPPPAVVTPKTEAPAAVARTAVPAVIAQTKPAPAVIPQAAPAPAPVVAVVKPAVSSPTAPAPVSLKGFAQTASSPEAILNLTPQMIRPLPVPHEFAGVVLASPLPLNAKPEPAPRKPEAQPALVIHSWKAEIASCPWDPSRRLMRFVAQLPVDQPGIESFDQDYRLVAKFDPFHVQGFRLVTEKHMRPSGGAAQATRFAWYEIIPTRNFNATPDKPVTIGSISIEQPRGASAPDSTPLKLTDRGLVWSDAREDFVFETAMIGWSMLLQGTENISGLNGKLVLDIAEKTKGEDTKGERTKFINVVKQAQRAVGL